MIVRRSSFPILVATLLFAALISTSSANAAAPEWTLSLSGIPSSFAAGASGDPVKGPAYRLIATNDGDGPSAGAYSLSDTLPPELLPAAGVFAKDGDGNSLTCESSGQTVACNGTLAVDPGAKVEMVIPVNVAASASGKTLTDEAKVEGGGAATVKATLETAVGLPAWKLIGFPLPTNLKAGSTDGKLTLIATNVGGASSSGPITVADTLPDGLVPVEASSSVSGSRSTCPVAAQAVACVRSDSIAPGETVLVEIHVEVDPLASPSLLDEASVEGGNALPALTSFPIAVSSAIPSFGFLDSDAGFSALFTNADGGAATLAGSHPHQLTVNLGWPTQKPIQDPKAVIAITAAGHLRNSGIDLPAGVVVNPQATPRLCTEAQLIVLKCPDGSQVGTVTALSPFSGAVGQLNAPLFNMVPPPGTPSSFGFEAGGVGVIAHIIGAVRSDGDYGLSGTAHLILARGSNAIFGVRVVLWGDPASSSHDAERGKCGSGPGFCPATEQSKAAFLTMPVQCTGHPTVFEGHTNSWEEPNVDRTASYESADLEGNPVAMDGCNQLDFSPTIQARPTTNVADAPSGLDVDVHQPVNEALGSLSPAIMKDIALTLPKGMAVNPASADGLGACSEAQSSFHTTEPSDCPDDSKIGSVEVSTPLLDHPLEGALYVAEPFKNPTDSLIGLYLAIDDVKASGVAATLAGKVIGDPQSGQLRSVFEGNPQLPIEDIRVHLYPGPRASLRTPSVCATHTSSADITPWSAPETPVAHPTDSFPIAAAPDGGSCPSSEGALSNSPSFSAGTIAPQAAAYSPFVLKLSRKDATQPLAGVDATLPPGLSGKLAGIALCSEAQLAQAASRSHPNEGALERANPSCPASTEVGSADIAAGAGPTPLHVSAHAYLAGPYKGAPLSLAIITPAIAGPFDLGAVLVRTALYLDPVTAQIHAVSDPFPQILEGIPLDLRSVVLKMDRPSFTLNPTSCDPMAINASVTSALGQSAALASPFQVGGCPSLAFKPKLSLRLKGGAKRADHPKLIATLSAKPGEANIASAQVKLPPSAFLDQSHIRTVCTRVQFAANSCPAGSIYGSATATTPLLDYPISGNVYLRSSSHKLPDLVVALRGPSYQPIEIDLAGKTDSVKGSLRNTFEAVPDAPVSTFKLELLGGRRGLVINSRDLCKHPYRAEVNLTGQNGKTYSSEPLVKSDCKGNGRKKRHGHRGA